MGKHPPIEAALPGEKVVNYFLKYGSVRNPLGTDKDMERNLFRARYNEDPSFSEHPFRVFDILTAEPSDPQGIHLKDLLDTLHRAGHVYPRIHCSFCRNELGSPRQRAYRPGYHNQPSWWQRQDDGIA